MLGTDKDADGSNVVWKQKKSEFSPKLLTCARRMVSLSTEIGKLWNGSALGKKVRGQSVFRCCISGFRC